MVDFIGGLSALSQALKITKELRDLDTDFENAELKSKFAILYGELSDARMALTDARDELHEKDREIEKLQERIDGLQSGEMCPICNEGRMKVVASEPDRTFGRFGILQRTLKCQNEGCGHQEKHQYEPPGRRR